MRVLIRNSLANIDFEFMALELHDSMQMLISNMQTCTRHVECYRYSTGYQITID